MKEGRIQQIAEDPIDLYDNPANKFVAGFIVSPSMNFFEVDVVEGNNVILLDEGTFETVFSNLFKKKNSPYIGKKVVLGIRPEDIYDKLFYNTTNKEVSSLSAVAELGIKQK